MTMDTYDNATYLPRILKMFRFYGCEESTLMSKQKLTDILNKQAKRHLGRNYTPNLIQEFWQQSETTSKGESTAITYSKIMAQGMTILQERINKIESKQGIMSKQFQLKEQKDKLQHLQRQYQAGEESNYNKINGCRKNIANLESHIMELKKNKDQFQNQLKEIKMCLGVDEKNMEQTQLIKDNTLDQSMSYRLPSPHLDLLFKVTLLGICLQLFILNYHPSFLALLCYLLIMFWLFLGYYDQNFVKRLIAGIVLSILVDISYVVMQMLQKVGNLRYRSQQVLTYISMGIIIVEVALRIIILLKLCLFRQPSPNREFFTLFNTEIDLNARSSKPPTHPQRNSYYAPS